MSLFKYKAKRNLKASREPAAKVKSKKSSELSFVVQEHHARQLHYDLRLEVDGVLKSWAIPKKPTLDPKVKRLAIHVEDHPYDYKDFEGTIPSGYGAGTVEIWDKGTYNVEGGDAADSEKAMRQGLKNGKLHFSLQGKKLKGDFYLIKLNRPGASDKEQWLFMKKAMKNSKKTKSSEVPQLTHLDKIYWPKEKITKGDLLRYYSKIAPYLLPYLKDRPESLKRSPNGIEGMTFFQKNLVDHPDWIETVEVKHSNKKVYYLLIQNEESLLYAANLGCIELHPFFSRIAKLQSPDFLIFDLDPKGASFEKVIQVAQELHELLEEINVPSYCKTSGATGLHIAIPLGAKYSYEVAKKFALVIASAIVKKLPHLATLERSISKRKGKVYIDCFQNNFGQTLASVYSVRARPGATVSTPLKWSEVKKGLDPKDYTIETIFPRLKKWGDLFSAVLGKGIDMALALRNLKKININ